MKKIIKKSGKPPAVVQAKSAPQWWRSGEYSLTSEPVLHHETGAILGYAVCVVHHELKFTVGVIAVCRLRDGKPSSSRWAAACIQEKPDIIDSWREAERKELEHIDDYREAKQPVPLPFKREQIPGDDYIDLYRETDRIADRVWDNLPSHHPVSILFELATRAERDDRQSNEVQLQYVRAVFFNLPEAERRRLFSGWDLDSDYATRSQEVMTADVEPAPVLVIVSRRDALDEPEALRQWELQEVSDRKPVRLIILAGTPKEDAITAIRAINKLVIKNWDKFIIGKEGAQ